MSADPSMAFDAVFARRAATLFAALDEFEPAGNSEADKMPKIPTTTTISAASCASRRWCPTNQFSFCGRTSNSARLRASSKRISDSSAGASVSRISSTVARSSAAVFPHSAHVARCAVTSAASGSDNSPSR